MGGGLVFRRVVVGTTFSGEARSCDIYWKGSNSRVCILKNWIQLQ